MTSGWKGIEDPNAASNEFNAQSLLIRSILYKMATVALVKVISVSGDRVAVSPLVDQIDGYGQGTAHGVIYDLPFFRLQGGVCGVRVDPVAGDIGAALFCSHDSSVVKATRARALPGSRRRFDWADGLYLGGFLNDTPTRYVHISPDGIELVDPTSVTITTPVTNVSGDLNVSGDFNVSGNTNLGGGTKFVMLADNTPSTTVKAK